MMMESRDRRGRRRKRHRLNNMDSSSPIAPHKLVGSVTTTSQHKPASYYLGVPYGLMRNRRHNVDDNLISLTSDANNLSASRLWALDGANANSISSKYSSNLNINNNNNDFYSQELLQTNNEKISSSTRKARSNSNRPIGRSIVESFTNGGGVDEASKVPLLTTTTNSQQQQPTPPKPSIIASDRLTLLTEPTNEQFSEATLPPNHKLLTNYYSSTPTNIYRNAKSNRETILPTNEGFQQQQQQQQNVTAINSNNNRSIAKTTKAVSQPAIADQHNYRPPAQLLDDGRQLLPLVTIGESSTFNLTTTDYLLSSGLILFISTLIGCLIWWRCFATTTKASIRRRGKNFFATRHDDWWPTVSLLTPSKSRSKRKQNRRHNTIDHHRQQLGNCELDAADGNSNCESVQLFDRHRQQGSSKAPSHHVANSRMPTIHDHDEDADMDEQQAIDVIKVTTSGVDLQSSPVTATSRVAASIKKHLAKNSLVVGGDHNNANRRPKVKLTIASQVRGKFIDDEARDLEQQQQPLQRDINSNTSKVVSIVYSVRGQLIDWLKAAKKLEINKLSDKHGEEDDETKTKEQTSINQCDSNQQQNKQDEIGSVSEHPKSSSSDDIVGQNSEPCSSSSSAAVAADQSSSPSNSLGSINPIKPPTDDESNHNASIKNNNNNTTATDKKTSKHKDQTNVSLEATVHHQLRPNATNVFTMMPTQVNANHHHQNQSPSFSSLSPSRVADKFGTTQSNGCTSTNANHNAQLPPPNELINGANSALSCRCAAYLSSVSPTSSGGHQQQHNCSCNNNDAQQQQQQPPVGYVVTRHSACQLEQHNQIMTPDTLGTCGRSCCSASPQALLLDASAPPPPTAFHGQTKSTTANYDLFRESPISHQTGAMLAGDFIGRRAPIGRQTSMPLAKRHYENYYDDEQEEAYCRLTASIGLQFGLNLDENVHNHHHHHHDLHQHQHLLNSGSTPNEQRHLLTAAASGCKCCSQQQQQAGDCHYPGSSSSPFAPQATALTNSCSDINCTMCHTSNLAELNHRRNSQLPPTNMTSILVQQPSTTTPPPPPLEPQSSHPNNNTMSNDYSTNDAINRWNNELNRGASPAENGDLKPGRTGTRRGSRGHSAASGGTQTTSSGAGSDLEQASNSATSNNWTDSADLLNGSLESNTNHHHHNQYHFNLMSPKRHSAEPAASETRQQHELHSNDCATAASTTKSQLNSKHTSPVRAYSSASPLLSSSPNFNQRLQQIQQQQQQSGASANPGNQMDLKWTPSAPTRRRFNHRSISGSSYRASASAKLSASSQHNQSVSNDHLINPREQNSEQRHRRRRMSFAAAETTTSALSSSASLCRRLTSAAASNRHRSSLIDHRQLAAAAAAAAAVAAATAPDENNHRTHQYATTANRHLKYRASIASDGSAAWWPATGASGQIVDTSDLDAQQVAAQQQHHKQQLPFGRPRGAGQLATIDQQQLNMVIMQNQHRNSSLANHRRPSDFAQLQQINCDLALYCGEAGSLGGGSSLGSSSGIGFSGSQCTNTPTAGSFPYSTFANSIPASATATTRDFDDLGAAEIGTRQHNNDNDNDDSDNEALRGQHDNSNNNNNYNNPLQEVEFLEQSENADDNSKQKFVARAGDLYPTIAMCQSSINHRRPPASVAFVGQHNYPMLRMQTTDAHADCGYSNRKLSLPVQLESRQVLATPTSTPITAPHGSPNASSAPSSNKPAATLLFRENLERDSIDSTRHERRLTINPDYQPTNGPLTDPATGKPLDRRPSDFALPGDSYRWWPLAHHHHQSGGDPSGGFTAANQFQHNYSGTAQPLAQTNRRSSQTITRQSSFWLDETGATLSTQQDSALASLSNSLAFNSQRQSFCEDTSSQLDGHLLLEDDLSQAQQPYQLATMELGACEDANLQARRLSAAPPNDQPSQLIGQLDQTTEWAPTLDSSNQSAGADDEPDEQQRQQQQQVPLAGPQPGGARRKPILSAVCPSPAGSSSSSVTSMPSPRDKTRPHPLCPFRTMAAARPLVAGRCRLSSSSTNSSAGSSPSPDFGRPSERILALGNKSKQANSITKRRLFGRLRMRASGATGPRLARPSGASDLPIASSSASYFTSCQLQQGQQSPTNCNGEEQVQADSVTSLPTPLGLSSESGESIEQATACSERNNSPTSAATATAASASASETMPTTIGRPNAGLNSSSASLERQCRDLWRLRATLHDDSCVADDNWTNYHQRLNRRYDSGYKSIENQFSSSVEGGYVTTASVADGDAASRDQTTTPTPSSIQQQQTDPNGSRTSLSPRPASGCSGLIIGPKLDEEQEPSDQDNEDNRSLDFIHPSAAKHFMSLLEESPTLANSELPGEATSSQNQLEPNFTRVELIDVEPRECSSRNSKSSNEVAE